jgi:hypothetical protein
VKKPPAKPTKQAVTSKPVPGSAGAGAPFDPTSLPDESSDPAERSVRPAPAPGVPMSEAQYEKLKRVAKTARKPPSKYSQEDPSAKK